MSIKRRYTLEELSEITAFTKGRCVIIYKRGCFGEKKNGVNGILQKKIWQSFFLQDLFGKG